MSTTAAQGVNGGSGRALVAHPLPDEFVQLIADRFRALAEPTRIKLLDRLREGEATVLELTALVNIADETVYARCEAVCGSLQNRFEALREITGATG